MVMTTRAAISLVLFISFAVDCSGDLGMYNTEYLPATKNTKTDKPRYSREPIFTVDAPGYNFIKDENNGKKKKKKKKKESWRSKLILRRKSSFHKIEENNVDNSDENIKGSEEPNFIHEPFVPDRDGHDDDDDDDNDNKASSPNSWLNRLKTTWSSFHSNGSPSRTSSSTSDTDRIVDQLLDEYSKERDNIGSPKKDKKKREEEIELPKRPAVDIENFNLCSEADSGQVHILDIFTDGKAPTCIFACLYYKMKHSVYFIKPEGRCARFEMRGSKTYGTTTTAELSCVCKNGLTKFTYRIVQREKILYYVHNEQFRLMLPLGTADKIADYVEDMFPKYIKDFLKDKKGLDWKEMYEYVRNFRWLRQSHDDRSTRTYLSESLKDEIDNIKYFWNSIPERMLRFGNNVYRPI